MTDLPTLLRLLPSSVVETLSPEQRKQLLKALSVVGCLPVNEPKTEPLKGPEDLLEILRTIQEQIEPHSNDESDEKRKSDDTSPT
jgi:hypothetical protein